MRKRVWILLLAGLLLAGCGESVSKENLAGGDSQQTTDSVQNGDLANEAETDKDGTESTEQQVYVFEFEDAVTTEGEKMSSEVFANSRLTMVNVWATFCGPCINEMPDLGELATDYDASEFQLIGIVGDTMEGDDAMLSEAKAIIKETGANYPHLLLNEQLYMNLVGASDSVPTTYFFNQKGELLGYVVGAKSKEAWEGIVNELLEEIE